MGLLKPLRGLLPQPRNCLGDGQRWHQARTLQPWRELRRNPAACWDRVPGADPTDPAPEGAAAPPAGPTAGAGAGAGAGSAPRTGPLCSGPFRSACRLRKDECARERMGV